MTKLCEDFGFGELKGSNTLSFEKTDDKDTILDESGQLTSAQLPLVGAEIFDVKSCLQHDRWLQS